MSKNRYDFLSTLAVIVLVASTFASQYFPHIGYIFAIVAILTAVGSFTLYAIALPRSATQPQINAHHWENRARHERVIVGAEARNDQYAAITRCETPLDRYVKAASHSYYWHHDLYIRGAMRVVNHVSITEPINANVDVDPATIIANVVEKLCATTKEPRYEFIISPDGTFKIKQIMAKHNSGELLIDDTKLQEPGSTMIN